MNVKYVVFSLAILTGASSWSAANDPYQNLGIIARLYASGASDAASEIVKRLESQDLKGLELIGIMKLKQYPLLYENAKRELSRRAEQFAQRYDGDVQKAFFEAVSNQPWALDYLVQRGANVNALTQHGYTALMVAASQNNPTSIAQLVAAGADLEALSNQSGRTALMLAAGAGNVAAATQLIASGANLDNISPVSGETALMIALTTRFGNNKKMVTLLINKGANVNIASPITGEAALTLKIRNADLVLSLLKAGANVNHKNKRGKSALSNIVSEGEDIIDRPEQTNKILQILLDHGADVENFGPLLENLGLKFNLGG